MPSPDPTHDPHAGDSPFPAQLLAYIKGRERFLLTSHARPDGDAIGSALGLMHLLETMGKRVDVAFADAVPTVYQGLPGAERILSAVPVDPPECAIVLECDSIARTGFPALPAALTLNIDHHLSGREYGDWNWIDPNACAVGVMVYEFAIAAGLPISPEAATCLYAAVLTDTGSFTFACTNASTFALAGHLLECGADANGVAQAVYFANPVSKLRILGVALGRMAVKDGLAWTVITLQDMAETGAIVADCEGVVNHLIGVTGVEAAAVLRENAAPAGGPSFRVSLRSKGRVNVALAAESFGGGGHMHASGCTVSGPQTAALDAVLTALRGALA